MTGNERMDGREAGPITARLTAEHRLIAARLEETERAARARDPKRLAEALRFFQVELRLHTRKEEEVLLPRLARLPVLAEGLVQAISRFHQQERGLIARAEVSLEEMDVTAASALLALVVPLLREHMAAEDHLVYPLAEEIVRGAEADEIASAFASIGWMRGSG